MKKVKNIFVLLLTLMTISGCASNTPINTESKDAQTERIKLTIWGGVQDQDLLKGMVESFKSKYADEATFDITVEVEEENTAKDRILEDVSQAADVFTLIDDQLIELAAAGVIEEVLEPDKIKKENVEGATDAATIHEKIYAYPMTADNGYFMFYNKKYFTQEDVVTLDNMLERASSLNKKVTMDLTSGWYLYSFFGHTGLSLGLNEDGITNYCDWNSSSGEIKGTDVGNAILAIIKNPGFKAIGDEGLIAGAKDGSVIAGVSGVWCANELQEAWGEDFAAVKLPTYTCAGKQVQLSSYAGYKMVGVNAYSEEKEWAAKLAEWLTNEENQVLRFVERGQGPSNTIAASIEEIKKSQAIQALIAQSEYASVQRVGARYWEPVATFGKDLMEGRATSENMQKLMDTMVKEITMKITDQ